MIAEAHLRGNRLETARVTLAEARALVEATGERWEEPELLRLQADVAVAEIAAFGRDTACEPPQEYGQAIALAREQGALAFEMRAALGLARWFAAHGRAGEARELLVAIRARFNAGADSAEVVEADALIHRGP